RRVRFVSSRRRHTISKRDWSSDVCSSDLFLTASDTSASTFSALFSLAVIARLTAVRISFFWAMFWACAASLVLTRLIADLMLGIAFTSVSDLYNFNCNKNYFTKGAHLMQYKWENELKKKLIVDIIQPLSLRESWKIYE